MPQIILETFNLEAAERRLCVEALGLAGNIVGAAQILGITRHAMKRRIVKLGIDRSRPSAPATMTTMTTMTTATTMAAAAP
jgi:transcriptional regulator with GAF, ATPase, and Fis domain